ncbi:insulinase family protein [bacterium]|nr:insulinase family protein [bacterium]
MKLSRYCLPILTALTLTVGCEDEKMRLSCEKVTLNNGLTVLLCQEGYAPVVTVGVLYHVGCNREEKGKTGFAHLFEHLMFSESQHVPPKVAWKLIQGLGGTMNGWTSVDHTFYHETVPVSGMEDAMWMEADRMGYLLPTMTPQALAVQQGVVINEKRETEVNVPYGYEWELKSKLMYGPDHPSGHTVIGDMGDLSNAKLADVQAFHEKYYIPRNATLVLCGRFDRDEALRLAEKYFGDIKGGTALPDPEPRPVKLEKDLNYHYLDKLAGAPDISVVFPGAPEFSDDSIPLKALAALLGTGKGSPVFRHLVEKKLAPSADVYSDGCDLNGEVTITARLLPGVKAEEARQAIKDALKDFEDNFASYEKELDRYKARCLREFYSKLQKSIDKAFLLAYSDEYAGSWNRLNEMADQMESVTMDDIKRVYETYVKGKPSFTLTMLPADQADLAMKDSVLIPEIKEPVVDESSFGQPGEGYQAIKDLPSSFDRSKIPPEGKLPEIKVQKVQEEKIGENIRLMVEKDETLPMAEITFILHGGQEKETLGNSGITTLTSAMLMEGTEDYDSVQFDGAIRDLGVALSARATADCLLLRVQTLSSNVPKLFPLIEQALTKPAFRKEDFARVKDRQLDQLRQDAIDPECLADNLFYENVYGRVPVAMPLNGTVESIEKLTEKDVADYFKNTIANSPLSIAAVGDIDLEELKKLSSGIIQFYSKANVQKAAKPALENYVPGRKVFKKSEDAAQSEIRVGLPAMSCQDEEYFKAHLMNFMLGGCFSSRLNLVLREEKAFTYGASSYFDAELDFGSYVISTAVDASHTEEALQIINDLVKNYADDLSEEDLEYTKATVAKSLVRRGETVSDRRLLLETILRFDYPVDYLLKRQKITENITLAEMKALAKKYIDPAKMTTVVVGPKDEQTIFDQIKNEDGEFFSFAIDGKPYTGFAGFPTIEEKSERTKDGETYCKKVKISDELVGEIQAKHNDKYDETEYTIYFTNVGDKPSQVISKLRALDTVFAGDDPVLRGIGGDQGNHHKPYEHDLTKGEGEVAFLSLSGRPTHETFPYYDLVLGEGGIFIALGWAGTYGAKFKRTEDETKVILKSDVFLEASLLPGEKIRTGLVVLLPYVGRDKTKAWNLWRRWFIECNMPRANAEGDPIKPFTVVGFNPDAGKEHIEQWDGSSAEDYTTWKRTLDKLVKEDLVADVHWFDAGWYTDPYVKTAGLYWYSSVGSWEVDKYKWPDETLRDYFSACTEKGMKNLMWFEPERVTGVDGLVENYGYKKEWAINDGAQYRQTTNDLGNKECFEWTKGRVLGTMKRVGADIYREDNNFSHAPNWKFHDEEETKRLGIPRQGLTENFLIQGHYALWDAIIDWQRTRNGCTFVDSCASGGGRNDIESMRRGIPFMRSDADRTTSGLRLSMSSTLPYWIPFHGTNNKETKGELDPPSGKGSDFYISRASYLPAAWGIGGQVTQNPDLDLDLMRSILKEWRSLEDLLLKDYYVLTPWHDENDLKGWTAFAYNDPEIGKAVVLAFRQDECEEDTCVLKLPFAKVNKTYEFKDEDSGKVWQCQGSELIEGIKATLPEKRSSLLWRINIK